VDRLMKHSLSKGDFTNKWRPLYKLIRRHLDTRSIYAHQPIRRTGTGRNNRAIYYHSIYIDPAEQILEKEHKGLGEKKELVARDLRKHSHSLEKLVKEVSDFRAILKHNIKSGP
jgi:hypothetical protein